MIFFFLCNIIFISAICYVYRITSLIDIVKNIITKSEESRVKRSFSEKVLRDEINNNMI
jgi:hypothetical protein